MALVLRGKAATRLVRTAVVPMMAILLLLSLKTVYAQVSWSSPYKYRGAATVSVATLQVPEKAWKLFEKARLLALKHQAAESERESAKALAIAPNFAAAHVLLASQQLVLHEYEGAIRNVTEARKTDPDAQWAGVILVATFNSLRRFDDAMTEIRALSAGEAATWQAKYEECRTAIGLGDEEQALKLSAQALAEAPKEFRDATLLRANALMMAHHWSEAKQTLMEYLATPDPQPHKDQIDHAMAVITEHMKAEETVNVASR